MRLFKHDNGTYYITLRRGKHLSLKTKDAKLARGLYKTVEKELALIHVYKEIIKENRRILREIEAHYGKIAELISNGDYADNGNGSNGRFSSEQDMQERLIPALQERYGLTNIREQEPVGVGIVDAIARRAGTMIIIEFKLGTIKDKHLGQCLRYLGDSSHSAEELWLVGEYIDSTATVFRDFKNIRLFRLSKSNRSKLVEISPIEWTRLV